MSTRIRRRITSLRRDEIEKEQEEQSHQIIRPFENVHGLPGSYTASSQSSFLNQPLTIKDTAVLYLSLIRSRSNYLKLCPMFQLYWVKQSSYVRKLMEQDKPIPGHLKRDDIYADRSCVLNNDINARDIMVKLLECGLTMGVHFFEIRVFIAKDERSDTKEEKERMKRERAEKKAQREQEKLERKVQREKEMKEREERRIQKENEKRENSMKKNDEQSQVKSSNTNSGTTGAKSEKSKSSVKVSKTATKDKKAEKTIKEEGDFKSMSKSQVPSAPSKTSQGDLQSSDNQRMITNLNYIGSKNKDFNDLMNEVAGGRATPDQITLFQKYIREAKTLGPPPHSESVISELIQRIDKETLEEIQQKNNLSVVNTQSGLSGVSRLHTPQTKISSSTGQNKQGETTTQNIKVQEPPFDSGAQGEDLGSKITSHEKSIATDVPVKSGREELMTHMDGLRNSTEPVYPHDKRKKILKKDIPKDQKLTAFQEKYLFNATVLFEFLETPNVRFRFPKCAICEVIQPSTLINSENGDNSDNKDILVSFMWIHNQKAVEKYELDLKQYEAKIKEQEEAERKVQELEKEQIKVELEEREELKEKPHEENTVDINEKFAEEDNPTSIEDSSMKDIREEETNNADEEKIEEHSVPAKRRAPPPRRGKKKRKGPGPKKAASKALIPPEEPIYSYSSISFTIHGIPSKLVPIFVNSFDPVDKVRAKMQHIIETGNRISPYQLWYQVDGKLDADLAESARVSLNQEEKKMSGIPTIQEKLEPKKYPKKKKAKESDSSKHTDPVDSVVVKSEPTENESQVAQ